MIDKIKGLISGEVYSPVTLFEVKNVISGEGKISLPEERKKKVVKKPSKPSKRKKSKKNALLDIIRAYDGPVNSTEILEKCLEDNICSRATFFRRMNKLVKDKKAKRYKKGKEVFYSIP
jgi:hypothetical protein